MVNPISSFTGEHRFLSNFWPCLVRMERTAYRSVEHAYQASKTLDVFHRRQIWEASTPGQAKRLGRRVDLRPDWDNLRLDVMVSLLRSKFQDSGLRGQLGATFPCKLLEGNYWHDNFWGCCTCARCLADDTPVGANHLGRLLMQVREENLG